MLRCLRSMTNRAALIRDALTELLAPLVAVDGGQIYLEQLTDRELSIHWAGRYAGSPATALLHAEVVVPLIERLVPGMQVKWTSGKLVPAKAELLLPRDPSAPHWKGLEGGTQGP